MSVGVQGESSGVMAQHGGQGFHVHSVLQRQHGECVTKVMEAYPLQSSPFQHSLEHMENTVWGHRASVW